MATALWRGDLRTIRPMLATLEDAPLQHQGLVYEPKYDGIRALVDITPGSRAPVRLWSRLGNEKTAQFPDLVAALTRFSKKLKGPVVLDGEIVALDQAGDPAGFQRLQNRIHLTESNSRSAAGRVAFIAFDILRDRDEDLRPLPLTERRARLERVFRNPGSPILRISEVVPGDGRALYDRALDRGWEGLIAKSVDSIYHTGKRTRDWRKLKIVHEQEFVVGGWTDSRTTGRPFGALLLGYYEDGGLTVRRPYGQRLQSARARAGVSTAQASRNRHFPVQESPTNQRTAALDQAVARRSSEVHGVDRRGIPSSSDLPRHAG